jgi:shikimate dehydrogenase
MDARYCLAGVMGWPVMHSRSPAIHTHWLSVHGLDGAYVKLAIPPERLEAALRALPALGFAGCNLTIPLKEEALRIVDTASARARRIGAVNCVVVGPDGALAGENTDASGWLASVKAEAPGWSGGAGPAVVLGAGGAARAVVDALLAEGATEIRLVNRSLARAAVLAEEFGRRVVPVGWEERSACLDGAALLVNTTSLGMSGQPALEIELAALPSEAVVSDIVYVPRLTMLMGRATGRGSRVVGGLGMLLYGAQASFASWFGVTPAVDASLVAAVDRTF